VTRQQSLIVTLLVALLGAYGFYTFALKPKRSELDGLQTRITAQQDAVNKAQSLLKANSDAKERYRAAYATTVGLGKAVPGDDDVRSLVFQLNAAAGKAKVDFRSMDIAASTPTAATTDTSSATQLPPGATVGPAGFPVMPFEFTFKGKFFRLSDFFTKLDAFVKANNDKVSVTGRLLTVNSLKLEADSTGFPNIKATVSAQSYLTNPLEGLTAGATASGPAATTGGSTAAGTTTGTSSTATTTATSTGAIR
jgi:hypothetical protein